MNRSLVSVLCIQYNLPYSCHLNLGHSRYTLDNGAYIYYLCYYTIIINLIVWSYITWVFICLFCIHSYWCQECGQQSHHIHRLQRRVRVPLLFHVGWWRHLLQCNITDGCVDVALTRPFSRVQVFMICIHVVAHSYNIIACSTQFALFWYTQSSTIAITSISFPMNFYT